MPYQTTRERRNYHRDYYHAKRKPKRETETGARDDRKMVVSMRIRASLVGRIMGLFHMGIAKGSLSHKTPSEFYAELLLRGLETLKGDDQVDEALQYLRAVSATDSIGAHRREAQAAFSRVKTEIAELLQIKADDQARQYYWTTIKSFEEMSPTVWRDWFLDQMQITFPKLAKIRPKGVALDEIQKHERRRKQRRNRESSS